MENDLQIAPIQKLVDVSSLLLPWWSDPASNILQLQTDENPESYLNGFYLYPIREFCANSKCEDIPKFVQQRFQALYSSASSSGISVMLTIHSQAGKTRLYLGLKSDKEENNSKDHFTALLNGIIPGEKINFEETAKISSMCAGYGFGGVVSGVPAVKVDEETQRINLSSVIRSLYGKDYTLSIISKPLNDQQKQNAFAQLISIRDELHHMAKQTIGHEKSTGSSYSENEQHTTGESKTRGHNVSILLYSYNWSKTTTENNTTGSTTTTSQNESHSLSFEQQNGIALELEKLADQYIQRYIKGFNAGLWETTITFAASDKISCDILGGTLLGELSKPSDNLLPPPRYYHDRLNPKQHLFLPKNNSSNPIFPKALASYVSSEELSLFASTPTESVPGFEIKNMPALALNDIHEGEYTLGNISDHGNPIPDAFITLSKNDLNKHLFVCGLTGSGKTTTVKHILKCMAKDAIPFLVMESAKRDYRQLIADEAFKDMRVYTIGDATVSPIRCNPFYVQHGVHPLVHIDYLKAIFNASFSLYGPMPHIIEKCLHRIYVKKGWNLTTGTHPHFLDGNRELDESKYKRPEHYYFFPTLADLKNEVDYYINHEMDYQGELKDNIKTAILVRLESLCVGAKGLMFNTLDFFAIDDLLSQPSVFEMESLADDDDKAFFLGLILVLTSEFRQKDNPAINPGRKDSGLKHFLVIEEAHRLLKNVVTERNSEMMGNPKGKAVEVFCNVIAEMRSLGQGVAVVEQIPSKISPDVIKNTNMKIVHRLVSSDDQALLAGSLGIHADEALYLNRLKTGHALCHKEGMDKPLECSVIADFKALAISDNTIFKSMGRGKNAVLHPYETYEMAEAIGKSGSCLGKRFLNSICVADNNGFPILLQKAKSELEKLIKTSNLIQYAEYSADQKNTVYQSFLCKEIIQLLTRGVYCLHYRLPDGFIDELSLSFQSENSENIDRVRKNLKTVWAGQQPSDFVADVVFHLILDLVNKQQLSINKEIIESFFLSSTDEVMGVVEKILAM